MTRFPCVSFFLIVLLSVAANVNAAELLMATRENCAYCKAWEIQVGAGYHKTAEGRIAPLRRIHISEFPRLPYSFREPVRYTPTFILVQDNAEIGRILGYSDEAMFWGLLDQLLNRLDRDRLEPKSHLHKADDRF